MLTLVAALTALIALPAPGSAPPPPARAHTIVGTVLRVDTRRHVVTLALEGEDSREQDVVVDAATRLVADGRTIGLTDVRIGARAVVVCEDDDRGVPHARTLKAGAARHAAPEPAGR
jgi:hypothetical protein